nr:integrase, catalytic region, zinc finger, CCHC-type, peptidase aspartic, catalytic [Tanacetum cinerariifolium]
TPQQNGVVERRNRTLVEAARTMALCYPKNDREDIRKLGTKGNIGFFIGYSADSRAYRVYKENHRDNESMYDDYIGGQPSATPRTAPAAQAPIVRHIPTTSTTIVDTAPTPTDSSSQATNFPNTSQDVDGLKTQQQHA